MDIIKLLPDSVANQIAAGEVIQRPASAVKELLENAVDSGATEITLIIKDSGKTLIQVIDNGCGMSEKDALLCFQRHATSKIREAADLFAIRTMGFRGEALASIAAIAQVELKTKRKEDELGQVIMIEGTSIRSSEPCQCQDGSSFSVKNLFYNVPARRNFLKSDNVEMGYIMEEFQRLALVNPALSFTLLHNGKAIFQLKPGNLKQRILGVFGNAYAKRLIEVQTETNLLNVNGFIGKPEFAKKTRGEQYFFANGRFIKHPYLHHAIENAFQDLLPEKAFPSYFLFLEVDPKSIDINIHPTKTEVKFEDERSLYAIVRSSVKQALGKFSLIPSLDFEREECFDFPETKSSDALVVPKIEINQNFNPFEKKTSLSPSSDGFEVKHKNLQWEKLYEGMEKEDESPEIQQIEASFDGSGKSENGHPFYAVQSKYILTQIKSGLMIIHQQYARERIFFERMQKAILIKNVAIQTLLFPQSVHFNKADAALMLELLDDVRKMGFEMEDLGNGSFSVNGIPADLDVVRLQDMLEALLEDFKNEHGDQRTERTTRLLNVMAHQMASKADQAISQDSMRSLIDLLFACETPDYTAQGKRTFTILPYDELEKKFK